jgi:act minimal PKS chain-length factor (CLF/KS beta)
MSPAAVVTGIGVIAPTGVGTQAYWSTTLAGKSGIDRISRFDASRYPVRLAGEVVGFDPAAELPGRLLPQTDRVTRFALAAGAWALDDAGIDPADLPEYGMGAVTASGSGGFEFAQHELEKLWSRGAEHVSAYQSFAWFYAVNTGQLSIRHGMRGPGGVLVTGQAGGLDAAATARRRVRGGTGVVVTGAADASLCPWGFTHLLADGRLSRRDDPNRAYLPFDADACGHVVGEGGAFLVVEDADHAARRGRRGYGEIAGYGATFDPPPDSGREPGLRRAIETALADAGAAPEDVDAVFADGAGHPDPDRAECAAITGVLGARADRVPVTAPKAATGRMSCGGSAVDLATALLALREGVVPPTANVTRVPAEYGIDLVVGAPRPARLATVLVLARGEGGFNSVLVLRAPARHMSTDDEER